MSVNVPTNPKIKEQDINTKLQLFGIYSAFANGKAPSNKQIDVALNSALASKPLSSPSKDLSAEGRALVADLRDVIEKAKLLLLTKNEGNLLQDFIWQCQLIEGGSATKPGVPVGKDQAKQHGKETLDGLRTLGTLILSNGQFRKLLNDAVILGRDIAGDAAQKAATKVNPSEDQLNQIDDPAEDNTWHDVPSVSGLKQQAKEKYQANKPIGRGDLKNAANAGQNSAQGEGTNQGAAASGAGAAASHLKETAVANLPEEHKQKAREYRERGTNYMKEKVPKERREQAIWRLKKMVVEIQGHQDYQQAIDTLLRLAEEYHGHGKTVTKDAHGSVKGAHEDDGLVNAETDLKILLERFANSTSSDDLWDSINQIYVDADNDPELKDWFKHLDTYIRKCLKEQGYILQDQATKEWNEIYDKGHFLLRERYRNHVNRVLDEIKFIGDQFDKDPHNKALANSVNKLFKDLGSDENGKMTFKPHLVKDLTNVILPGFFENIRYVPIPRIEYSDPMADAVIENLVIEGDNLAPNVFELGSDNFWRWGRRQNANSNKNKVMLSVSGIQMDLRDVSYYVHKKQGFPSIKDTGLMDIFLGGTGLSFKAALETADPKDAHHFFKVNSVVVDVKNMKIKLKKSKFKALFGIVRPLLMRVMRPVIQKVAEKQIRDNISKLDAYLYSIKKDADRAAAEAQRNPDPDNVKNIYQRYLEAYKDRVAQGKKKTEEKATDKQVNVAMTQHDSIFPNIQLPGGISSKATEYKNLAAKGDKWESPVFTIGSARESSNVPRPDAVTRKPHETTQSELRSRDATSGTTGAGAGAGVGSGLFGGGVGTGAGTGVGTGAGATGGAAGGMVPRGTDGSTTNGSAINGSALSGSTLGRDGMDDYKSTGTGGTQLGNSNPVFTGQV